MVSSKKSSDGMMAPVDGRLRNVEGWGTSVACTGRLWLFLIRLHQESAALCKANRPREADDVQHHTLKNLLTCQASTAKLCRTKYGLLRVSLMFAAKPVYLVCDEICEVGCCAIHYCEPAANPVRLSASRQPRHGFSLAKIRRGTCRERLLHD